MASSTALYRLKTFSSPPTQIASLRDAAPAGPPLTGASSMCRPFSAKAALQFLHDARRIRRQVEIGGAGFHAGDESVRSKRNCFNIGRFRQRGEDHVAVAGEGARIVCPGRACIEMMTRRLSLQIMDDQLVAGLLQVGAMRPPMMPNPINPTTTSSLAILNLIS